MAIARLLCLIVALAPVETRRIVEVEGRAAANPIRKVVSMLQGMQKKITEEGEKEKALYEKFQCYCSSSGGTLTTAIKAAEAKVPAVSSDIEEAEAQKSQLEQDLTQHQADRADAKKAMQTATALREKEAGAFAAEKAELDANIGAITKAVAALEKGMTGGFLQTTSANVLKQLAMSKQDMLDVDRQAILAFLSGSQGEDYAPASGEITGILKELGDEMAKSLAAATTEEEASKKSYDELMAAKTKEVQALTAAIETKTQRVGEVAVSIVQMKDDLSDTQQALLEDQKFFADLEKGCSTKATEWDERVKTRAEELVAISETIKVLNDDDALDLFKKTLPSASASFVQVATGAKERKQALSVVQGLHKPQLDFIVLALKGKKVGFEKVIKMIDAMVATLKEEQISDDNKKEYCGVSLDSADDKKKSLERAAADTDTDIANTEEGIAATTEDISGLTAGITALDKSVAEATEQRKQEHADFTELVASDSAAKDLLKFAKNRLNKFYNKKLYKPPPKRELSEQDRIVVNMGGTAPATAAPGGIAGTGVTVLAAVSGAPPPPPETFGAYAKKSEESTGVIAMIDMLIKDLDKEMTEAQTEEKDAQADYEKTMSDSAAKRAADSESLTQKESTKADLEMDLVGHKQAKTATAKELAATAEYTASLHAECDWLVQYYDVRKEARAGEIDSLVNAKAILSGADFAGVQTSKRGFLEQQ